MISVGSVKLVNISRSTPANCFSSFSYLPMQYQGKLIVFSVMTVWQIDIRDDPFGLLAAHPMAPLVSLHHLEYVQPLFPNQSQIESLRMLTTAYEVDPARTMQQSFCYYRRSKWSISVSWAYAVQIYPWLLSAKDLETPLQTFRTWRSWSSGPFTFNTRPMSSEPCERPLIFYLDSIKEDEKGKTVTTYKKLPIKQEKKCNQANYARAFAIEKIVVSSLKMDPEKWKKVFALLCLSLKFFISCRHDLCP